MALSDFQLPPPKDWQKFERLCRDIWARVWNYPDTQLHGRQGQPQCGVDVYGYVDGEVDQLYAVQCKGKDQYNRDGVTEQELIAEVKKATNFVPKIKSFVLATTAPNDTKIQKIARELSQEYKFRITVMGWDSIVSLLSQYDDLTQSYLRDLRYLEDKNKNFFIQWYDEYINIQGVIFGFDYNCNILLNVNYDIFFQQAFIDRLVSFCQSIDSFKQGMNDYEVDSDLFKLFYIFRHVVFDLNYYINNNLDHSNKFVMHAEYSRFWVDLGRNNIGGNYLGYKKHILKALFYKLISSVNSIILYYNRVYGENIKLINFRDGNKCWFPCFNETNTYIDLNHLAKLIYNLCERDFDFVPEFLE